MLIIVVFLKQPVVYVPWDLYRNFLSLPLDFGFDLAMDFWFDFWVNLAKSKGFQERKEKEKQGKELILWAEQ